MLLTVEYKQNMFNYIAYKCVGSKIWLRLFNKFTIL